MPASRPRLCLTVASLAVAVVAALIPAVASAAKRTFGPSLSAPATKAIAHGADSAFWLPTRVPISGQVLSVRVEGCAKRGTGGQAPLNQIHFQDLKPAGGTQERANATSGPESLPICSGASSARRVTTFHPVNLCVAKGDYVDFNDSGGFVPGSFPAGVPFEIFSGTGTTEYSPGTGIFFGQTLKGTELLMKVTVGNGRDGTALCPGGTKR